MRDCPNQRALIIREDGEYTLASEVEEEESSQEELGHTSGSDPDEITFDASHTSLIVCRVLSSQMEQAEKGQHPQLIPVQICDKGALVQGDN